jgi:lipoate-protein ligase A
VGAVSRRGVLGLRAPRSLFDVEQFRNEPGRIAVAREVAEPTLVLGSTQSPELVDAATMRERGVGLARRRGGGGAVFLGPGEQLWLDVWIPRDDPLWAPDVSAAAEWVGVWWTEALAGREQHGFDVHRGRSVPGDFGDLVCFAGRGPGEVFEGGRKLVGLSQWRPREGALFSSCAYLRWDPAPLVGLLDVAAETRADLGRQLRPVAAGLAELGPLVSDLGQVQAALLDSFPAFELTGPPTA